MAHLAPLALEVIGNSVARSRVGDEMGRIGGGRTIAPGKLVLSLRAGLDAGEAMRERPFDGLVVTKLEVQEGLLDGRAPVPPVERVRPDEVERAGDRRAVAERQDQKDAVRHALADQRKEAAVEIRAAPLA